MAVPQRQVLGWFQPFRAELFAPDRLPVFNVTVPEGRYYGTPVFGIPGFKVGCYHHHREDGNPLTIDRNCHPQDETTSCLFVEKYFPAGAGPTMGLKTCIFTNTPDEHFIIDLHPDHPQVCIASPCSGHGFKFLRRGRNVGRSGRERPHENAERLVQAVPFRQQGSRPWVAP